MIRQNLLLVLLALPLAAATSLPAPILMGEHTDDGFLLEWILPDDAQPDAILLTVTNGTTQKIITLPGDSMQYLATGQLTTIYTIQYQQAEQTSAPSNPQGEPLGYPRCHPLNIIGPQSTPPFYWFNDGCVLPTPV